MALRVALFGTHPKQFNGYSKVVYELTREMVARHGREVEMHVFGFQNFHDHPGHRLELPAAARVYDAHAEEEPKSSGFGFSLVRAYVARVRPHVCVVFNDLIVLTTILNELHAAPSRRDFKVVAYIDQVYRCQRKHLINVVNERADAAIAFTPEWRDCIVAQGLRLPCHVLAHGFNPRSFYPVRKDLARRFFGLPQEDFLVLNLNRNQPRKRWDTCLQAFAQVVARLPDAPIKLVIGTELHGAWELLEVFERELGKHALTLEQGMRRLVVPGHAQMLTDEETNILYNVADVGINTCDGEGFGLCNFEQAAVGVPQVVPRLGGFLHFFDDTCATLVEPRLSVYVESGRDGIGGEAQLTDPRDYADAIVAYYVDAELRRAHGAAARARILRDFSWARVADDFRAILASVAPPPAEAAPPAPGPASASASASASVTKKVTAARAAQLLSGGAASSSPSVDLSGLPRDELRALRARIDALLSSTLQSVSN